MSIPNKQFLGLADIFMKPYGTAGSHRPIGSVAACQVLHNETEVRSKNYGRVGGTLKRVSRLDSVGVQLTLQSLSVPNLAQALRATVQDIALGTVTDEAYTANLGGLIRLPHIAPTSVVVKNQAGDTTYVNGTDYVVSGAGIMPLIGGNIGDASTVQVSYSYGAHQIVEALSAANAEQSLVWDGINEANDNKVEVIDLYRASFSLPTQMDLIGDEFANLQLQGELLVDPTRTGVGASKFYRWTTQGAG